MGPNILGQSPGWVGQISQIPRKMIEVCYSTSMLILEDFRGILDVNPFTELTRFSGNCVTLVELKEIFFGGGSTRQNWGSVHPKYGFQFLGWHLCSQHLYNVLSLCSSLGHCYQLRRETVKRPLWADKSNQATYGKDKKIKLL